MVKKIKTHEEFLKDLYEKNEHYRRSKFTICSEYVGASRYIVTQDKFGLCKTKASTLLLGCCPNQRSALNKHDYLLNKLYDNNEAYRKGSFRLITSLEEKSVSLENKYGVCKMIMGNLLDGKMPTIRSAVDKPSYFINQAKEIHGDKYDYSKSKYVRDGEKVCIICPLHGEFWQTPSNHLQNQGCTICGDLRSAKASTENPAGWNKTNWYNVAQTSKQFDSYKVYVVECWDEETGERFFKVGRTFKKVRYRLTPSTIPYKYRVLKVVKRDNRESQEDLEYIYNLETRFKRLYKNSKYMPEKEFPGLQECFKLK